MSAGAEDPDLLSIAASISTGGSVEWELLEQRTSGGDGADLLHELRVVEQIARFHRNAEESETAISEPLTWGHFSLIEQVGTGAFGSVYRATDRKLECQVALKLLSSPDPDRGFQPSLLLKEARLLAKVRHPNVVMVYGADSIENRVGIWMEFVKGHTLEELLRTHGPFGAREAALVGLDLCRALAAVHRAGLMHGDVKAHNVMREEGGRTVLMDFGTGKDLGIDLDAQAHLGDLAGTPLYLAPEIFEGRPRTKTTDLYSLGVLLYHLVTQGYPVDGATAAAVKQAHVRGARTRLRDVRPDLPDEFVQIVERAVAPEPQRRWASAGAFEAELARFLGARPELSEPISTRAWAVAAVAFVALSVLVASGYWLAGRDRSATGTQPTVPTAKADRGSTPPAGAYTIDAALYRERDGSELRLQPGTAVRPGDRLSLDVRVSTPTHVYVVNEDDRGESFLLFPLPGQKLTNPLPAGPSTRLPGDRDGAMLYWQVTSAGGREHFLIFASPEPVPAFERMFALLPRPELNAPVVSAPLSSDAVGLLRGVGGLISESPHATAGPRLTGQFTTELGQTEETARGLWVRQITLDNPSR